MKKVLLVMVVMFLCMGPLAGIWVMLFQPIVGGGAEQTYLYPIYGGIILLSGIVVGCTVLIIEEIRALKKEKTEKEE